MTLPSVGIRSIAVSFPSIIRTNDYYRENYPELVARVEQKTLSRVFSPTESTPQNDFEQEMMPYLSDPFRGSVERRVFAPGENALTISYSAAKDALKAAKLSSEDIDLMLVATIFPDQVVPGNAAFLAAELGLHGAAWNIDSTCSNAIAALQTASGLVRAGEYRNVLVVICTNYSPFTDQNDTLAFLSGDGAGAFVVSALKPNQGVLGTKIINTASTCGTFFSELTTDEHGNPRMFIRAAKGTGQILSETAAQFLKQCCSGALEAAGVTLDEISFFAFNTPTAWYADLCTRALGIEKDRTINLHDRYANIGPMLPLTNLYHGVEMGKIRENDLVLVYAIGSVSNAGASVMRWGDVAIGPAPALPASQLAMARK
ncbi:MAG: 3-oxoacyl-[acyl-carrier-protein] synthase III C-terminal domain-containing protein [Nostoc sp. DedQUE12b]|uniref:3-oxoacyl-ACP synthase III family protein n=1 Tax=Nostoc sp. DedQUE12b TaxID=3075398 RepID=UPI002AD2F288|nr:3-oxoacyl-[acyl-carrier-protein] synthase III C-terminal domain-containing protein [Nostoc sp. DedQUE12b]MDZ8084403.1 3-oxoacyl-[acyl-carrier-protein] synthase III C-terminal domain-containing protein [Nostoc sp. DedQUE12b]